MDLDMNIKEWEIPTPAQLAEREEIRASVKEAYKGRIAAAQAADEAAYKRECREQTKEAAEAASAADKAKWALYEEEMTAFKEAISHIKFARSYEIWVSYTLVGGEWVSESRGHNGDRHKAGFTRGKMAKTHGFFREEDAKAHAAVNEGFQARALKWVPDNEQAYSLVLVGGDFAPGKYR